MYSQFSPIVCEPIKGKTSLCEKLISMLPDKRVALISQDSFYKPLSKEEKIHVADKNFDAPDALDFELMQDVLLKLQAGKRADVPIYDYTIHARKPEQIMVFSPDVILFEVSFFFFPSCE